MKRKMLGTAAVAAVLALVAWLRGVSRSGRLHSFSFPAASGLQADVREERLTFL